MDGYPVVYYPQTNYQPQGLGFVGVVVAIYLIFILLSEVFTGVKGVFTQETGGSK